MELISLLHFQCSTTSKRREPVRVAPEIVLTNEERAELTKLVRSKLTSVRLAVRARIVLLAEQGPSQARSGHALEHAHHGRGAGHQRRQRLALLAQEWPEAPYRARL